MRDISRRTVIGAGTALGALGVSGILAQNAWTDEDDSSDWDSSPDLEKYVQPLPVPEKRTANGKRNGADYHEVSVEETQHQFHPDLGETTIWGYDGQFPGPIIEGRRGERLEVHFDNSQMPEEHLFEVDERIRGTTTENYVGYDGPVPEVRNSTHFHGLNIRPEDDGQADMWTSPDGVTGPRFGGEVQELPNRQPRLTSSYHAHTRGISRLNNYAGLVGPYYIRSQREDELDLPDGDYDIPLVLADRSFNDDGSLHYPDEFVANFAADTPTVNGAAWPYLEVEPRRYRFRILNLSNARTYELGLENVHEDDQEHESDTVPTQYQISPGHGFLDEVVSIGHDGDLESLVLAPFERADVIVDFSEFAGETFTVKNSAEFPYSGGMDHGEMDGMSMNESDDSMDNGSEMDHSEMDHGEMDHPQINEVMQFRVTESVSESDTSTHPTDLSLPERNRTDPNAASETREITMGMGMDDHGLMVHTLNDRQWGDGIQVKPQLGTTEVWELVNDTDHTHPIHLHLVAFDVIERERHGDDHEPQPPLPNERGGKDVVRVNPGETVRIAVEFGDFTGRFPFHCHILEHEEHDMMRSFEVVDGSDSDDSDDGAGDQ